MGHNVRARQVPRKRDNNGMRLRSLAFAGYRSFAARSPSAPERLLQRLRLAPLTILLGKNNSGKSTVGRLLHHVLLAMGADGSNPFPLSDHRWTFGSSFRAVQHDEVFFNPLDLEISCTTEGGMERTASWQLVSRGDLAAEDLPVLSSSKLNGSDTQSDRFRGLLPATEEANPLRMEARQLLSESGRLGPLREPIQSQYKIRSTLEELPPETTEAMAQLLYADKELCSAVGAWTAANLDGWRVDVKQTLDSFQLIARRAGRESNLADAGQGIQQVLPVATLCSWRALGRGGRTFLDVVEQPELHLHDAAHAPIGDLLLSSVERSEGSLVVETHSESIVLRVRRRIAEGLDPARVAIFYVEDRGDGSQIREIGLRQDGEVAWWPEGVFSEAYEESKAIRRAQRQRDDK
jgi:hypothetical protein